MPGEIILVSVVLILALDWDVVALHLSEFYQISANDGTLRVIRLSSQA